MTADSLVAKLPGSIDWAMPIVEIPELADGPADDQPAHVLIGPARDLRVCRGCSGSPRRRPRGCSTRRRSPLLRRTLSCRSKRFSWMVARIASITALSSEGSRPQPARKLESGERATLPGAPPKIDGSTAAPSKSNEEVCTAAVGLLLGRWGGRRGPREWRRRHPSSTPMPGVYVSVDGTTYARGARGAAAGEGSGLDPGRVLSGKPISSWPPEARRVTAEPGTPDQRRRWRSPASSWTERVVPDPEVHQTPRSDVAGALLARYAARTGRGI